LIWPLRSPLARDRRRAAGSKREGRKALAEINPRLATRAKELRATGLSLRAVSAQLAVDGFLNVNGKPYKHMTVRNLVR